MSPFCKAAGRRYAFVEQSIGRRQLKRTQKNRLSARPIFTTISGHPVRGLYTSEDLSRAQFGTRLRVCRARLHTRGIHPSMYRSRLWTMRQFAGFGSAQDTNERFRYLLTQGQSGLSVAFDLPTLDGV